MATISNANLTIQKLEQRRLSSSIWPNQRNSALEIESEIDLVVN